MELKSEQLFEQALHRIYAVPPNDLGNKQLTFIYKRLTGPLKQMTFFYIVFLSGLISVGSYLLLGQLTVKLVSLLQYGF
jgi:hypothetical protein